MFFPLTHGRPSPSINTLSVDSFLSDKYKAVLCLKKVVETVLEFMKAGAKLLELVVPGKKPQA